MHLSKKLLLTEDIDMIKNKNRINTRIKISGIQSENIQKKIDRIRSNLLILVDNELNILKLKCPTKVNHKSMKEAEKEYISYNKCIELRPETFSSSCLIYNKTTNGDGLKQKLDSSDNFKAKCKISKNYKRLIFESKRENLLIQKTVISLRNIEYFRESVLKDMKDKYMNHNGEDYIISETYSLLKEKTPFFKSRTLKFGHDLQIRTCPEKKIFQKSLMYLHHLIFLLKNPFYYRKVKSNTNIVNLRVNKLKSPSRKKKEIFRRNDNIFKLPNSFDFNFNTLKIGKNYLGELENKSKRSKNEKQTNHNKNPPISKICIEESKRYFFGGC